MSPVRSGIAVTAPLVDTTAEPWRTALDVNLTGVFHRWESIDAELAGRRATAAGSELQAMVVHGGRWFS